MSLVSFRQTLPATACVSPAQALRPRPVEAVARAACKTFLGHDAITIELDDGRGRQWCQGLASLRREYHARRNHLQGRHGSHAWLCNLDYEMGLRAVETLAGSLCHLFDIRSDDFARRALAMECVAALSDSALTGRDESGLLAHTRGAEGITAARATHRMLRLSRVGTGKLAVHKETRWDGAALPVPPAGTGIAAAGSLAAAGAIRMSTFDARLELAVLRPSRWRLHDSGDGAAQRARLRCEIQPVQLHRGPAVAGAPEVQTRWRQRLALAIRIVRHLFRRLVGDDMALRLELRLVVHPRPRGYLPPCAVRVGEDWRTRQSTQPLCHGVRHGYADMRRADEQLRRRLYRLDTADTQPQPTQDDSLRLY